MLFITIFFIFSLCFVFYVIWNQFLKKDTRLSIGLKVLQKKMNLLEDLSQKTDTQLRKGIELLDKKNRELEKIVSEARFCIFKMEKLILNFESKASEKQPSAKLSVLKEKEKRTKPLEIPPSLSSKTKEKLKRKTKFQFGESPFVQFVEKSKDKRKSPHESSPDL